MERLTDEQRDFIEGHLGLAGLLAIRANPGRDADDSFQDAVFGLARAVRAFDPSKGKFSTYAYRPIREEVGVGLETAGVVRVPRRGGRRPTDSPATVAAAALARRTVTFSSLEAETGIKFDPPHVADGPDAETIEAVRRVLATLPARSRDVLRMRMDGMTFVAIGAALGITQERARQIEARGKDQFARAWLAAEAGRNHQLQEA